jgi:hypothetical protein
MAQVTTRGFVVMGARELTPSEKNVYTLEVLTKLEDEVASGRIADARTTGQSFVDRAKDLSKNTFDPTGGFVMLVWVGTDAAGKNVVRRLLLQPPAGRPFALDLPGIASADNEPKLFELFLTADVRSKSASTYTSTREEHPLVAKLPDFIDKIIGPLFDLISAVPVGKILSRSAMPEPAVRVANVWATASRVMLPFRRASITVKDRITVAMTPESYRKDLEKFVLGLRLDGLLANRFAAAFAVKAVDALSNLKGGDCVLPGTTNTQCIAWLERQLTKAFDDCSKTCVPNAKPNPDDVEAMTAVREHFNESLKTLGPEVVEGESSFSNRPPTTLSFGGLTGVILKGSINKPRAKLDGDTLVADPMSRLLTMAVVNWTPWGYDADSFTPTIKESFRLFAGGILTPDFGVGGGGSIQIVRGVAVNAGAGLIFSKAVATADALGSAPADARKPFELGTAWAVFVGASFYIK